MTEDKSKVILFYHTMWGEELSYPKDEIPEPFFTDN